MNINQSNILHMLIKLSLLGLPALMCIMCIRTAITDLDLPAPPVSNDVQQQEYTPAPVVEVEINEYDLPPLIHEYVVTIDEPEVVSAMRTPRYTLTVAERHLLKFVADREDSHSVESRLAVMQVVMNRVNDNRFPNTVRDVLFQQNQFHVMPRYHTGYIPTAQAYEALERLLYGECIFNGANAIFFAAARVSPDRIARRLYLIAEIGGSRFWGQVRN